MDIQKISSLGTVGLSQVPENQWLEKRGFYQFSVPGLLMEGDLFRREKISLEEAFEIANRDPRITHFVYDHRGDVLWLVKNRHGNIDNVGGITLYQEGEAVFFSGWDFTLDPCDPEMADVSLYIKA